MDEGLLNDLLECSVCLERLDTSSRVLPCQHTFCLKCLKVIIESHKELRCPECRVLVEAKVEELPPNVLLMRILEGMKNSAPRKSATGQRTSRSGHSQALQGVQGGGKQLPPHARAMYDYISKEPGDLSFKKGETILIQKKLDTFWYQGECSGRTGMFPLAYVQVVVPLPVATALCKALYDFRMSAPDEEGCLAFDKGAIITVHRRVDDNWAEGRLDQRVGIFPIAFVELNQAARQLMNSVPLNRPVPPIPEQARPSHSEHRHHVQQQVPGRYPAMSLSAPGAGHAAYQNVGAMSQSQPSYHAQGLLPQPLAPHARNIVEPAHTKHSLDLIQFTNVHNKSHQGTMGIQSVSRIGENYDRLRTVKYDSYNSTPVHKVDNTYQNVRTHEHFPVSVANFNTSNVSSDSSSSMNTPSFGVSSTTTPNTSSDTSTCESAEPSLPSSPDNNTERNATVIAGNTAQIQNQNQNIPEEETNNDESLNTSMGVLSLNESSTATNTSLNVSLPPSESPKLNASGTSNASQTQEDNQESALNNDSSRLDVPSSSKNPLRNNVEAFLNFGLGLQAALSPSHGKDGNYMVTRPHRDHHHKEREKRHSLTPSTHLQGNHNTQNRHSAEILATSLLDAGPEARSERRRRRSRSNERPLPAAYVAIYPYKPQKPDELELKKGGIYTVTERCRDGWYKGCSERSQRCGVFPGNYVAPASNLRTKHDKSQSAPPPSTVGPTSTGPPSAGPPSTGPPSAGPQAPSGSAPDAPPRARDPALLMAQPLTYPWCSPAQSQQSTPRSEKPKEKSKAEKSSISTGVSLMKRLAAMKKCKSPPPTGYSMDNPVFEDGPGTSLMLNTNSQHHPVHVRSGSCPSQLLRALPPATRTHKERPTPAPLHEHHHHLHRLYANTHTSLTHAHTRSGPHRRPCTNITTICTGCMPTHTHPSHTHTQGAAHTGAPARTSPPSAQVVCQHTHIPHTRTHKERPTPAPLHEHHHHLHRLYANTHTSLTHAHTRSGPHRRPCTNITTICTGCMPTHTHPSHTHTQGAAHTGAPARTSPPSAQVVCQHTHIPHTRTHKERPTPAPLHEHHHHLHRLYANTHTSLTHAHTRSGPHRRPCTNITTICTGCMPTHTHPSHTHTQGAAHTGAPARTSPPSAQVVCQHTHIPHTRTHKERPTPAPLHEHHHHLHRLYANTHTSLTHAHTRSGPHRRPCTNITTICTGCMPTHTHPSHTHTQGAAHTGAPARTSPPSAQVVCQHTHIPHTRTHKERPTPAPLHEHHHHLHRLYANTHTSLTHAHTRSGPHRRPCTNITTICTGCMPTHTHPSHTHTQGAAHTGAPARTSPPSAQVVCQHTHIPHTRTHKERPTPAPLHEHHHHLHRLYANTHTSLTHAHTRSGPHRRPCTNITTICTGCMPTHTHPSHTHTQGAAHTGAPARTSPPSAQVVCQHTHIPHTRTHKERPTPAPLHEHHHHLHRLYANTHTSLTHAHTRSGPHRRPCTNITTICTGCMPTHTHPSHTHTQGAAHTGAPARTSPPSAQVVCKHTHTHPSHLTHAHTRSGPHRRPCTNITTICTGCIYTHNTYNTRLC
ncbi:uncharacterized protein LOC111354296 isoform X3 [Spodoptera litura]|uniref:Uncharacterized protein LOC111354296 isoform X3 n=1 Tax=Spodoptera litura TaxID=69820 RepID=A0A9J7E3I3_SPOLT|nr:uncharacterized protein LOC111354296 isoform X3 [Spodoptera litura]